MSNQRDRASDALDYVTQLHRAVHAAGLFIDEKFGDAVTQPEALVLLLLLRQPESTINDVHRAFLHRRSTLTSVVDRLVHKRLLSRDVSHEDRRAVRLVLTAQGARLARAIAQAFEERLSDLGPRPQRATATLAQTADAFWGGPLRDA